MKTPAVFTPDEIARFKAELASKRVPGAYEEGKWSLSPLNRQASVTQEFPASIRFRDATLRSVETLPGVVASEEAKAEYLRRLVRAGVSEIVTGGLRGRDDAQLKAEIDVVKSENPNCRVLCPLVSTPADIDRAAAAGYDGVQVWIQGFGEMALVYQRIYVQAWNGEEWRTEQTPRTRHDVVAKAAALVAHARSVGLKASTPLLMVSYLTTEMLEEAVGMLVEAGVNEITLFDGPGAMSPEAFGILIRQTKALAPGVEIGLHPHNTFGLAVACAVEAAKAGADVIELSVNGYCGGPGNADLAATTLAFEALYGVKTGIHTEQLTELARAGEALTGYHVAWNHPLTGKMAFSWGGMDIITQETTVDPLLHNCVEPALVGNQRWIPFTPDSGAYTLAYKLGKLGFDLSHEQVNEILELGQAAMKNTGKLLSDDDLTQLAQSVTAS